MLRVFSLLSALLFSAAALAETPARRHFADPATPRLEVRETKQIDFTDPAAFTLLNDGWHSPTGQLHSFGADGLASMSIDAGLTLSVLRPRDMTLHLRLQPNLVEPLGAQEITIVWNGTRLGVCTFDLAEKWSPKDFSLAVPADAITPGDNEIRFLSRYAIAQGEAGTGDDGRIFAFAIYALALSADEAAPAAAPAPTKDSELVQAADTRLVFPVYLEEAAPISFTAKATPGDKAVAAVLVHEDTMTGVKTERFPVDGETLDLGVRGPGAVSVTLESLAGPTQWDAPVLAVDAPAASTNAAPAVAQPQAKNVVLIILDALRADHMGYHGYPRDTTPFIDSLAADGLVFPEMYSAASYTFSSTFSLVTGYYQFQHGAKRAPELPSRTLTRFPSLLRDAGIFTACIAANPNLNSKNGTVADFDLFENAYEGLRDDPQIPKGKSMQQALKGDPGMVTRKAEEFLDAHGDDRFLLYTHYRPPHHPYYAIAPWFEYFTRDPLDRMPGITVAINSVNVRTAPITDEARKQLVARYDENLRVADEEVRRLHAKLEALGIADDTAIIVTSDHGEAFMEHGLLAHALSSYNAQVHVPLMIYVPGADGGLAEQVGGVASTVDLYPTLCGLLGVTPPEDLPGRNLLAAPPVHDPGAVRALAETSGDHIPHQGWFFDRYKLVRNDYRHGVEVYDLQHDPTEQHDLATQFPVLADFLLANALHWRDANTLDVERETSTGDQLDADMIEQLEALGYVE